ncbi:molybdopterin synthase catalytic subunit isoform X2 [Dipodomys spectabilis]|uniref:molybdopterin synthase catalytic subunit isoform X2 n=1 Tax=Dipodomys spectabilis TaxID=105255 RepID=UPI001C545AC3|nr:molybdopterin synthase catalytic subunit isoform X2 [Dipodomys spectabilis]
MSSSEISSSCFNQEMRSPSSPPLVEGSTVEQSRKEVDEVEEKPKDIIKFTAEKLAVEEVSRLVISPLCGAISLFVGTTRNNFEGKKVISLEYEAYLPMAENEIRKICSDIRQKWPVKHIAVFHRLGKCMKNHHHLGKQTKNVFGPTISSHICRTLNIKFGKLIAAHILIFLFYK